MKPLGLGYQTLTFVKTSACCTTLKIQSLSSIEHVVILVINI
jgi:c-di-GMP-related signal transduction protein